MTHGSLFAGIGGFDLGFERAGFETVWQVEIDEYCRRVLERHFPRAERFRDIRDCGAHNLKRVDVISGGFPCQDISGIGLQLGIDGERSGLWKEYLRIIRLLRPRYAVMENVTDLLDRGIGRIIGKLAESGYDAEWDCLPASAFGATHQRDRVFIVAYPNSFGLETDATEAGICNAWFDSAGGRHDAKSIGAKVFRDIPRRRAMVSESELCGMANGIPERVDRIKSVGNAVVPQIAQWIAERIKAVSA